MKSMNKHPLKQEERRIKHSLIKQTDASPLGTCKNLNKPSSVMLFQKQRGTIEPSSPKISTHSSVVLFGNPLPKFVSCFQQSSKTQNPTGKKKSKSYVPFSNVNLSMCARTPKPPAGLFAISPGTFRSGNVRRKGTFNWNPSSIYIQEGMRNVPSMPKLTGENFSHRKVSLNKAISEYHTIEPRLKKLLLKSWQEEANLKRDSSLSNIKPEDMLRCRYLRLSEKNINHLLQLCEDSGLHVDIHPHMKECDINIHSLMSLEKTHNTVSL